MATVDKAFRIKNGLVVEGSTATVNGSNVLTEASTEFLQDTTAAMFTNGSQIGISFTYNDSTGVIDTAVSADPVFGDKITFEGTTPDAYELILQVIDPAADVTVTLPNATDTLVGKATTDTLTNKTISGANNTLSNIGNSSLTNSAITINGTSTSLGGSRTLGTDDIAEGATNKYFTDERSVDAVAAAIANGTQTNITITYNDEANSLSFNASGGVSSIAGTANQIAASASTGAVTLSLPSDVVFPGTVTLNAAPLQPLQAATKQYVDDVAQGLHIHESVVAATTANLTATYSNGTDGVGATLTNTGTLAAFSIDNVSPAPNARVLIKNQAAQLQNGIYTVTTAGSGSVAWVLTRATDMDQTVEVDGGDFVFVTGGDTFDSDGFVQTETGVTIGVNPILFTQFSGSGTFTAGNGLTLTGNEFSINTAITADLSSVQTFTNKTLTSPVLTNPSVSGLYLSDNNIVIEGTTDTHETTLTFTDPTQDNTITFKNATGTVAFTADIESAIDSFGGAVVGGTGISSSYNSGTNVLTVTNTGVTSLAGTTDQITASTSTGAVTLSLPQNIASTSSPTFAALSVGSGSLTSGSVTLADALLGTATATLTTTNATVIDTWSATTFSSAKYIVQMKNGNDIETLEVLINIDGNNNVYITEYADVISNAQLGTTNADYLSGNVRLLVTSTNGTTVKVHKTLIEA